MPYADANAKRAYNRKYLRDRYANDVKYRKKKNAQRREFGRRQWEALALVREMNDMLLVPAYLQERVDALLDGYEPKDETSTAKETAK